MRRKLERWARRKAPILSARVYAARILIAARVMPDDVRLETLQLWMRLQEQKLHDVIRRQHDPEVDALLARADEILDRARTEREDEIARLMLGVDRPPEFL